VNFEVGQPPDSRAQEWLNAILEDGDDRRDGRPQATQRSLEPELSLSPYALFPRMFSFPVCMRVLDKLRELRT
jgi:hypothetical protein